MIPFMTSDGEYFYTSDGKKFLVRNHAKNIYSVVQCGLTTPPTKTRYMVGETFDPTGMVIQVQYQNRGQQITRQVTTYTYSTSPLEMGTTSINIHCTLADQNYADITVPIVVYEPVISIAVTTPPTITNYYYHETFDPTGMIVTATIDLDGTVTNEIITNYTYPTRALDTTDSNIQIQWTYMPGYTTSTTQAITVSLPTVTLALTQPPTKTRYDRGEYFDPAGMVVTATIAGSHGPTSRIINDYFYNNTTLGGETDNVLLTWIYENQVTATLEVPITVVIPQISIEVTQNPNRLVYEIQDYFDPAGMIVEATVVTANATATYAVSNYTYLPNDQLTNTDTEITLTWLYEDQTATATIPIAVRTQQVHARDFDGTEVVGTDPNTGDPWIPWPTVSLTTADAFSIGVKLRQNAANTNDATVFSNIRLGGTDYGLRLGIVNGNYVLTWGSNNTLLYMPNTANSIIALMIEHEASSDEILVTYYNLNASDDVTYTNSTSGLTDNNFVMAVGAGLDSSGNLNTTSGSNDKWLGTLIDFSIFNNTIPTREDVEKYLGLEIDMNSCIEFESNSSFTLQTYNNAKHWNGTLEYSNDTFLWNTWDGTTTLTAGLAHGKYRLLVRGSNNTYISPIDISNSTYSAWNVNATGQNSTWVLTGSGITVVGNIATLLDYNTTTANSLPTMSYQAFCGLFRGNSSIVNAANLILPYDTLTHSCYKGMFQHCTALTTPPQLPATTLSSYCYAYMFYNNLALTTAPTLSATTLVEYCYSNMFFSCYSLTTAPQLPATTLAPHCYSNMFEQCRGLTTVYPLPATTLTDGCYLWMFAYCSALTTAPSIAATTAAYRSCYYMFYNCTSLTTPPTRLATTLADSCYQYMFYYCTHLTTTPQLPATTLAQNCYSHMFDYCRSLTTMPALQATTLAQNCYHYMFDNCTSLVNVSTLPATTLQYGCYQSMFEGCSALTTMPIILGTTDNFQCCSSMFENCTSLINTTPLLLTNIDSYGALSDMFKGCTSLVTPPQLNSTTLGINSYEEMFSGCTSLTTLPELPATTLENGCYEGMFSGCTNIKLSATQTGIYQKPYRIPTTGTGTDAATSGLTDMFTNTGGTFTGTPSINTTYYLPYPQEDIEDASVRFSSPNAFTLSIDNAPAQHTWDGALYTSTDLETWTEWDGTTSIIADQEDDEYVIYINGLGNTRITNTGSTTAYGFSFTGSNITVEGNLAALLDYPSAIENTLPSMGTYAFYKLFYGNTNLIDASDLILPFTSLTQSCYNSMFYGCSSLTTAPSSLPATTLVAQCYRMMFEDCTSLTTAPIISATTMADYACYNMFMNCSSLITAPTLSATTLALYCYGYMFDGCTSLRTVATLPATTLAEQCYYRMFTGCTALVNPPAISATSLASQCCYGMFYNCTALTSTPTLSATTLASQCYSYMFYGCTSLVTIPLTLPALTLTDGCYRSMFQGCSSLTAVPTLPATTLATYCYYAMFQDCTSLNTTPTLSVNTLVDYCYGYMFSGCTSLTTAPALPATSLAPYCYVDMFFRCASLVNVPSTLPATTLAGYCYQSMFQACSSLRTTPTLPGTSLALYCYSRMFQNCTSLTAGPALPATSSADHCYSQMFYGCTSLTSAPNLPATGVAQYCYQGMFRGCTALAIPPTISATTLQNSACREMFYGCTSLLSAPTLPATTLATYCYYQMFYGCSLLLAPPTISATTLGTYCCYQMFQNCTNLRSLPVLSAITLTTRCYYQMFYGCTNIKLSETQVGEYQTPYRIPASGTGADSNTNGLMNMFSNTGGTFTGTPSINTTYYLADTYYLTFSSPTSFTLKTKNENVNWDGTLQYSNNGTTWNTWDGTTINSGSLDAVQKILVRGINNTYISPIDITQTTLSSWSSGAHNGSWALSGSNISIIGNIACLLDYATVQNNSLPTMSHQAFYGLFAGYSNSANSIVSSNQLILPYTILTNNCYTNLFSNSYNMTNAPQLPATNLAQACYKGMFLDCRALTIAPSLPATTLTIECYNYMFDNCYNLTTAPTLPATTLAVRCYAYMFYCCQALTTAPSILATSLANYCCQSMFYSCTSLTTAPALPAETLASDCYRSMFYNCTSLTTTPQLPATNLAEYCYYQMFLGCSSLTTAPTLPAETLARYCYTSMFQNCTSLTTAPALPAETLANDCYESMFQGCAALVTAPALPATTLADYCYRAMFSNCTALITPPQLPATTLESYCYNAMFHNCTSLTTAPELPATTLNGGACYYNMFWLCTSLTNIPKISATIISSTCCHCMFYGCTKIKISETQVGEYQTPYRIPFSGTGTAESLALENMFQNTGGTFTGTPTINTTYYTSNTVI